MVKARWSVVILALLALAGCGRHRQPPTKAVLPTRHVASEGSAPAPQPLPSGPKAHLAQEMGPIYLALEQRRLMPYYEKYSAKDARWDQAARGLIEHHAAMLAGKSDMKDPKELLTYVEAADKAGCDDAMVRFLMGDICVRLGRPRDAVRHLEAADKAQAVRPYPQAEMWTTDMALLSAKSQIGQVPQPEADTLVKSVCAHYAEAIATLDFRPGEQRCLLMGLDQFWETILPDHEHLLIEAIAEQKKADPWIAAMLRGRVAMRAAWKARGTGAIDTIPQPGIETMEHQVAAAADAFGEAYRLHPEFPEAATDMIEVVMVAPHSPDATVRTWFDRAVAAEFDHSRAYDSLAHALTPRWGGSHEQQIALAEECLATERYDTKVPWVYYKILDRMLQLDQVDPFVDDAAYAKLRRLCEAYAKAEGPSDADQTTLLGVASRTHRWADAEALRQQLGDRVDGRVLRNFPPIGEPASLLLAVQAHAQYADKMAQAEAAEAAGDAPRVAQLYDELAKEASSEELRGYLAGLGADAHRQLDFDGGRAVTLPAEPGLRGWAPQGATWSVADGWFTVQPRRERPARLNGNVRLTAPLVLSAEIEVKDPPNADQRTEGIYVIAADRTCDMALVLARPSNSIHFAGEGRAGAANAQQFVGGTIPRKAVLSLTVQGGKLTGALDGKPLITLDFADLPDGKAVLPVLAANDTSRTCATVRFGHVTARSLAKR